MMSNGYFLGVDVGSASVRAGLYSAQGERLSFATVRFRSFTPATRAWNSPSAEIWQQVCAVVGSRRLLWDLTRRHLFDWLRRHVLAGRAGC